jgi:glycosyltransferase involved in cell wall biosynthesis
MTVMDLLYVRYPEWLPNRRARWYWNQWIPLTARHAKEIIVPSEATKQDLICLGMVSPERITVVPLAVDPLFLKRPQASEIEAFRIRRGLSDPYVLYVGIIDRRKDLSGLVRAYARLRSRFKGVRLVIAGHLIPGRSTLLEDIESLGLKGDVVIPGYVSESDLPLLYGGASVFAYPSWWEGFGLPPLEAMAMGVPVITYRNSSLPEVVGDAAILIDPPFTGEALEEAMVRILEDDALRAEMVKRGEQRAYTFSWERAADQTMSVYRQCLGQAG